MAGRYEATCAMAPGPQALEHGCLSEGWSEATVAWVRFKGFNLSSYNKEAILFTIVPYSGHLKSNP